MQMIRQLDPVNTSADRNDHTKHKGTERERERERERRRGRKRVR